MAPNIVAISETVQYMFTAIIMALVSQIMWRGTASLTSFFPRKVLHSSIGTFAQSMVRRIMKDQPDGQLSVVPAKAPTRMITSLVLDRFPDAQGLQDAINTPSERPGLWVLTGDHISIQAILLVLVLCAILAVAMWHKSQAGGGQLDTRASHYLESITGTGTEKPKEALTWGVLTPASVEASFKEAFNTIFGKDLNSLVKKNTNSNKFAKIEDYSKRLRNTLKTIHAFAEFIKGTLATVDAQVSTLPHEQHALIVRTIQTQTKHYVSLLHRAGFGQNKLSVLLQEVGDARVSRLSFS